MAKCAFCSQRKGKRICPALGQVCSQCCGENRQGKIACPPGCGYLRPSEGGTGGAFGVAWQALQEYLLGDADWGRRATDILLGPERAIHDWAGGIFLGWISWGFVDEKGDRGVDRWVRACRKPMGAAERQWVDVLRNAWLSLFRVTAVKLDIGLELEDILDGKRLFVRERSGTCQMFEGQVILGWIAAFPEHNELTAAVVDVPASLAGEAERTLRSAGGLEPGRDISPADRTRMAAGIPAILKEVMAANPGARGEQARAATWEAVYEVRSAEKLRARLMECPELIPVDPDRRYRLVRRKEGGEAVEAETIGEIEIRTVRLSLRARSYAALEEGKRALEGILEGAVEHRLDRAADTAAGLEAVRPGESLDPAASGQGPEETEAVEAFDEKVGHLIRDWVREGAAAQAERGGAPAGVARRPVPRPEGGRHALPLLGHEAVYRRVPGLREACREAAARIARIARGARGARGAPGDQGVPPVLPPAELIEEPVVEHFLRRYLRSLARQGYDPEDLMIEQVIMGKHIHYMVHHELHGRKTFWVDESLAWMLSETDLDISGSCLRLPFPSFAIVFTDPGTLEIAESLLSQEKACGIRGQPLRILTVYVTRIPAIDPDISNLDLAFIFDDCSEKWPYLLDRELWVLPEANLAGILDSRPPDLSARSVDPVFLQPEMKKLVHICVNAILYAGSAHLDRIRLGPRGAVPPEKTESASRAGGGLVGGGGGGRESPAAGTDGAAKVDREGGKAEEETSAEEVFYLPGKIPISHVAGYRRLPKTETGRRILTRFLVRGHWRRANPSWNDQRLRWIEPYWKGPDIGHIIEKQYLLKP